MSSSAIGAITMKSTPFSASLTTSAIPSSRAAIVGKPHARQWINVPVV